jgi:hypothetical protein
MSLDVDKGLEGYREKEMDGEEGGQFRNRPNLIIREGIVGLLPFGM